MKNFVKITFIITFLFIFISCTTTTPPNTEETAPTPTNLGVDNFTLYWSNSINIKEYLIEMTINDNTTTYTESTTFNFKNFATSTIKSISFRVKALSKDTIYQNDSPFSAVYTFNNPNYIDLTKPIEKEILTTSFINAQTAPSGWKYNYQASIYKDTSLKFANSGESITSPTLDIKTSFKVEATILGKNASGDAIITVYGLDSTGTILEKYEIKGPIPNEKASIDATFTNTNIKKIKFEYTTKALGNFGLFEIKIYHVENNEVLSISTKDITTTYYIGDEFDYKGSLDITYVDGSITTKDLNDIKDELTISNFKTNKFDKDTYTLTYLNKTCNINYQVGYSYPSLFESFETCIVTIKKELIYININSIDIIINLSNSDYDKSILKNNSLEYYIAKENDINDEDIFISLNSIDNITYHITPTTTIYYTPNGILFSHYLTDILINTTNDINDSINKEYEYVITTNSSSIPYTKNIIFNTTSLVGDYNNFSKIYQSTPATSIYDTSIDETITLTIDDDVTTTSSTITEISYLSTWDYDFCHDDSAYIYNHKEYYASIYNLTGDALKNALSTLISSTHTNQVNYDYARDIYPIIDPDFDDPGNIILFYSGQSISGVWDKGNTFNREHVWPKSLSGGLYTEVSGSDRNAGTDLHQLRPASTSINSSRKNKPYGPVTNDTYFEPRDEVKGDVARILFYMSIRYNMSIEGLNVVSSLDLLIEWHENDPVSYQEEYRNEQIKKIQGNYNPFIDNPWLVNLIF